MNDKHAKVPTATEVERRSLEIGKWANLFMAAGGVTAAHFSNSDALLVDGLYSGVNFASAIVAARVSAAVMKPADRRYPFGYDAHESLYVTFRSLILVGIVVFAGFNAVNKIVTYLSGGEVPELVFGPILVYMVVMVTICFSLAYWHRHNWLKVDKQSDLLQTESHAAIVDGVISMGAGGALLAASLLRGTPLSGIVPVADAITVLVMSFLIVGQPLRMFRRALREVAGEAASEEIGRTARERTEALVKDHPFSIVDVIVTKLGRTFFVVPYLKSESPVEATQVDTLRRELLVDYRNEFGLARAEIIVTAESPFELEPTEEATRQAEPQVVEDETGAPSTESEE